MNQPFLVIVDHAEVGDLTSIIGAADFHATAPDVTSEARDVAVQFFNPMVNAGLLRGQRLVIHGYWRDPQFKLDAARCRLLDRVALTLGAVIVAPQQRGLLQCSKRFATASPATQGAGVAARPPAPPARGPSGAGRALAGGGAAGLPGWVPTVAPQPPAGWAGALAGALAGAGLGVTLREPGAGAWRVDGRAVLVVGDRPNNTRHGQIKQRLPFFSFHHGGCSLWLNEQLDRGNIPEDRLYWINAYDCDGVPTGADFVKRLNPQCVVTLGEHAERWCEEHALDGYVAASVPHPMFWKRFKHREPYPLVNELRRLL